MHLLTQRCRGLSHNGLLPSLRVAAGRWSGRDPSNSKPYPFAAPLPLRLARSNYGNGLTRPSPPAFQTPLADAPSRKRAEPYEAKAVVIGGGPAGMAAVANLLEAIPDGKVVWIDKTFQGGTTWLWQETQSYSWVEEFLRFARHNDIFREICNARDRKPIEALERLDGKKTCCLRHVVDMLNFLSDGLLRHERVRAVSGTAETTARDQLTLKWTVTVRPPSTPGHDKTAVGRFCTPLVVLCTGSRPRELAIELPRPAALGSGLDPRQLNRRLHVWMQSWAEQVGNSTMPMTVAVVGDSHSAVMTLHNLSGIARVVAPRLRIRWFTREANLKYTKLAPGPLTDDPPRTVLNERDGLRGVAAAFALRELEGDKIATSKAGAVIERLILPKPPAPSDPQSQRQRRQWEEKREELETQFIAEHLDGVHRIFQCIGFERAPPPEVRPALAPLEDPNFGRRRQLAVNDRTGSFYPAGGDPAVVIGLFGAGSAFPESVEVADGPRRPAVSMAAYGEFVKRMAPQWVEATWAGQMSGEEIKMLTQEQWMQRQARMKERKETAKGFEYY
ncbi:pyridine nucleotide-disulfide oxidoreductase-domain-containing protein [Staphylotrichum tortipilum]|uniref:Pyridine nucleotide-disulfide oxidoreductase-domain-containing protein n=1 Tax=Staphylotrichum tortipilum TaxID=2831512 RepID=A0AAN6MDZ4_9PEZI|nr:pyridine nucleotide-disulfide oxidoreductase-domain-containing protein [Staphylotrichum longicolle]